MTPAKRKSPATVKRQIRDDQAALIKQMPTPAQDVMLKLLATADELIAAIDEEHIAQASFDEIVRAIGTLIDRYLKLKQHASESKTNRKVTHFVFHNPDGSTGDTPFWATGDFAASGAVHSRSLRQTLRENRNGQADSAGASAQVADESLVDDADAEHGR